MNYYGNCNNETAPERRNVGKYVTIQAPQDPWDRRVREANRDSEASGAPGAERNKGRYGMPLTTRDRGCRRTHRTAGDLGGVRGDAGPKGDTGKSDFRELGNPRPVGPKATGPIGPKGDPGPQAKRGAREKATRAMWVKRAIKASRGTRRARRKPLLVTAVAEKAHLIKL